LALLLIGVVWFEFQLAEVLRHGGTGFAITFLTVFALVIGGAALFFLRFPSSACQATDFRFGLVSGVALAWLAQTGFVLVGLETNGSHDLDSIFVFGIIGPAAALFWLGLTMLSLKKRVVAALILVTYNLVAAAFESVALGSDLDYRSEAVWSEKSILVGLAFGCWVCVWGLRLFSITAKRTS